MEGTRREAGESGRRREEEGTTGDERRPRNAGALGVREEPARVQEEEPRRGAGGGTLPGCGRRNPPGCGRRNPLGCGRRDPAGSDGYGLGEGPAGTQDVVRAPVTVAQVPSLGQRPRHRHLQRGHVNTRHPPTHTHTHCRGPAGISTGNGKLRDHTRLARVYGDEAFTMPLLNLRQQLKHPY